MEKSIFTTKTFWVNVIGVGIDLLALSELTTVLPASSAPYISLALAVFNIVLRRLRSEDTPVTFSMPGGGAKMVALLLIPTLMLSACGLRGSARHTAVVADTSVYTALAALQDGEAAMYQTCVMQGVAPSIVQACAAVVKNHPSFNAKLAQALRTGQKLNRVIRNWPPDKPAPEELPQLANELRALTSEVAANFPDNQFKAQLLTWTTAASNAVLELLLSMQRSQ